MQMFNTELCQIFSIVAFEGVLNWTFEKEDVFTEDFGMRIPFSQWDIEKQTKCEPFF